MMGADIIHLVSWLFLAIGGLLYVVGAIGVLRMPDFFTRLHAASVSDGAAIFLLMCGLILQAGWSLTALRLVLMLSILLYGGVVVSHALASAAVCAGVHPVLEEDPAEGLLSSFPIKESS